MRQSLACLALVGSLAGCAAQDAPRSTDNIGVTVAPLQLPGIGFACYDILIQNEDDETVVALGDPTTSLLSATPDANTICSTQYGNGPGGAISYIAPCDASRPDHTVTLWVDGLYTGTPSSPVGVDYEDPCAGGCTLNVPCEENSDTEVVFNLTIMRPALQGFFDIAVNFDDIFCSAKVDCVYEGGDEIMALFDPASNERGQTVMLALACTSGAGADDESPNDTVLFRNPIVVDCDGNVTVLDPSLGEGNVYTSSNPDPDLTDSIWQYATYFGTEELPCDDGSCNKRYWNVAIGFDPTVGDCNVTTSATAADASTMPANLTPAASTYPWIDIDVQLTNEGGGLACSQHPLNGTPAGVSTRYTAIDAQKLFCHSYDGAVASVCSDPTASIIGARTNVNPARWSDGTFAATCNDYLEPADGYAYSGATGDGIYRIDPSGGAPFNVYCDMTADTPDGAGWTRLEGALYPFLFADNVALPNDWQNAYPDDPAGPNFSALSRRFDFASGGCYAMRITVGDGPDHMAAPTGFTAWTQCHDAFTAATDGSDYSHVAGDRQTALNCPGYEFIGLHNSWGPRHWSRADDIAAGQSPNCWTYQIAPVAAYTFGNGVTGPYLDGTGDQKHAWQSLWYR